MNSIEILEGIRAIIDRKLKKSDIENLILNKDIAFIEVSITYKIKESDLVLLNSFFKERKDVTFLRILENEWLEYLPELTRVEFAHYTFNKDSILYLKKLNKVDSISFSSTGSKKTDISFLLDYKDSLEKLSISGNIKTGQENIIKELKKIKRIDISYTKIDNLDFLKELPNLAHILIEGSRISDYLVLFELNNLKSISIISNKIIEDFTFIEKMLKLEKLFLGDCSNLIEVPKLSHLKELKELSIMDCRKLQNWSEIDKLDKNLVKIFVSNKELIYKNFDY